MMPASDTRASSKIQGEILWANCHAQNQLQSIKTNHFTSIHIWTSSKILSSVGANNVNIGFQSKFQNPMCNSMVERSCPKLVRSN